LSPAPFLEEHFGVFADGVLPGPVLDLACGDGHNGIFLASKGLPVVCCDRSPEALEGARKLVADQEVTVELVGADLEQEAVNPLPEDFYGGILVFRYLHRPLIPCIRKALKRGGVLMYETFTIEQARFGKPHNPDFLLKPGELRAWFDDWEVIASFEGIQEVPRRAIAQILCRKH
jgi:SAM-dependent methyltransferase